MCKLYRTANLATGVLFFLVHFAHAATHARRPAAKAKSFIKKAAARPKGQSSIDDVRATQLQTALIHAGYLTGEPSGHWDVSSAAAMTKLQADNGWQTKLAPDSRAIIKLGLGPSASSVDPQKVPSSISSQ